MKRPKICAVIVNNDSKAIEAIEPFVDLFEVRIDLVGNGWESVVRHLGKPWIACNRRADEGGKWIGDEDGRIKELVRAVELGAGIVDIELQTENLNEIIKLVNKKAKCLVSFHDLQRTPSLKEMTEIVQKQLAAGADICKVITTAQSFDDNLTVLPLIKQFPKARVVAFAMGSLGLVSRVLCPLVGGDFTYASIEAGRESAPGQITARELRQLYEVMGFGK